MEFAKLRQQHANIFPGGARSDFFAARAPGRVNLIGEHTDYNAGFVCPMAIDRSTVILGAARSDARVRLHSLINGQTAEFSLAGEIAKDGPAWALYAKGAAEAVRRKLAGKALQGFDGVVDSTVPLGGGLSSSASFEVATALAVLAANGAVMDKAELALACQWAEHHYPGVPCGIMDQFASVLARAGHAMLLDCRDQSIRHVPLDEGALRIVISNSNVKHELTGGEYKSRREQCEAAARALRKRWPEVNFLRDATMEMLEEGRGGMEDTVFRRARHVIGEIGRTVEFAAALESRDYPRCGQLMIGSHESLRDDFEVSTPELDALVEIARGLPGVYGARMTGGGFGGCIVALCEARAVRPLTEAIDREYPQRAGGHHATTFATVPSAGAGVQTLAS